MASTYRLPIPLKKETRRQLQALADAQSCSLTAVCSEFLDACAPEAYLMAEAIKLAKKSPAAAQRRMAEALETKLAEADQYRLKLEPQSASRKKKTG